LARPSPNPEVAVWITLLATAAPPGRVHLTAVGAAGAGACPTAVGPAVHIGFWAVGRGPHVAGGGGVVTGGGPPGPGPAVHNVL